MRSPEVLPFADEHLDDAGRLLAARHRRHRAHQPFLDPRFEDPDVAREAVAEAWAADDASGTVGLREGRVVGFLLGAPKPGDAWGPNCFVESAGHAVDDADPAETARELYAVASARWVEEGRLAHYALLPAPEEELVRGWFRLGFGHQQTHAVRALPEAPPQVRAGLTVREPTRDDIPVLARLELELPRQHRAAPTFSAAGAGSYEESLAEWEDDFDNPDFANAVVEHDGVVVASASGCSVEKSSTHRGPARPERAWLLSFAAVLPTARGLGAGRAAAEAVHWAGVERGFPSLVTDWRETNLTSTRAWRGLGYRDTFTRVHRLVGR